MRTKLTVRYLETTLLVQFDVGLIQGHVLLHTSAGEPPDDGGHSELADRFAQKLDPGHVDLRPPEVVLPDVVEVYTAGDDEDQGEKKHGLAHCHAVNERIFFGRDEDHDYPP